MKGEEKGRRNQSGQEEPQLTVTCDKISASAMETKRSNRAAPCWAVSSPPGTLSPGAAQEECVWAENYRRSEDTTAGDSQLMHFLWLNLVSHF